MIIALLLTLVAAGFRLAATFAGADWMMNFSPLAAIALCGAFYLPRRMALALPLAALLVSDLVLNAHYGASFLSMEMLPRYAALAAVSGLGMLLSAKQSVLALAGASIGSSFLFYLVTNTASWLASASYAKTAAGWVQALTVGVPGYPPTYLFFRNSLASDLLFTLLFVACMHVTRARATQGCVAAGQA